MKKTIIIMLSFLAAATSVLAQDRAVGVRVSTDTFEASYLCNLSSIVFFEADLGKDNNDGDSGIKGELMMNIVLAKPQLTAQGSWSLYSGLGIAGGYVYDESLSTFTYVHPYYGTRETMPDRWGTGPMLGVALQAGASYTFDTLPIRVSLDFRPILGLHRAERIHPDSDATSLIGIYGAGITHAYIPKLSVHYLF